MLASAYGCLHLRQAGRCPANLLSALSSQARSHRSCPHRIEPAHTPEPGFLCPGCRETFVRVGGAAEKPQWVCRGVFWLRFVFSDRRSSLSVPPSSRSDGGALFHAEHPVDSYSQCCGLVVRFAVLERISPPRSDCSAHSEERVRVSRASWRDQRAAVGRRVADLLCQHWGTYSDYRWVLGVDPVHDTGLIGAAGTPFA